MTTDPVRVLHTMAVELGAMAQNGLYYATDKYDLARYRRMREMTGEILELIAATPAAELRAGLDLELGHATPKLDVRGALFDGGKVLLVKEVRDGRWTLPGGWVDALDEPRAAAEREFAEEAGLRVRTTRLAAVHDGSIHNGHDPVSPWHVYKLFFLVERTDDAAPTAGLDGETSDVGFFRLDDLPELSTGRTTAEQLALLLAHAKDDTLPTDVD